MRRSDISHYLMALRASVASWVTRVPATRPGQLCLAVAILEVADDSGGIGSQTVIIVLYFLVAWLDAPLA